MDEKIQRWVEAVKSARRLCSEHGSAYYDEGVALSELSAWLTAHAARAEVDTLRDALKEAQKELTNFYSIAAATSYADYVYYLKTNPNSKPEIFKAIDQALAKAAQP